MRSLAFVTTGLALAVAIAPACGGGIPSSCSNDFDALLSVQSQCGAAGMIFTESERSDFITACEAAATAPGSSNGSAQLDSCANDMKARGCLAIFYAPPSCFFRGTLPDGSACGTSQQCAGGVCVPSPTPNPSSEIVCGVCASFLPAGASCSASTYPPCDPTVGDCDGTTCAEFIPHGAACPQSNTYCAPGDECTAQSICDTVPTAGQSCNVDCNGPANCINGVCVARAAEGEACNTNDDCNPSLTCNFTTQKCEALPPSTAGESCGYQGLGAPCDSGLICSLHSQTCVAPVPLGGACTVGLFQCSPFAACVDGACAMPDYTVCK